jgi:hypothetical protein
MTTEPACETLGVSLGLLGGMGRSLNIVRGTHAGVDTTTTKDIVVVLRDWAKGIRERHRA